MIRKMIAALVVAGSVALLAPAAAQADDAFYSGPVYPWSRVCVDAWGTSAQASGWAEPGLEFIVRVRAEGSNQFNFRTPATGTSSAAGPTTWRVGARSGCALATATPRRRT